MVVCPHCGNKLVSTDVTFTAQDAFYRGRPLGLTPRERHVLKLLWDLDFVDFFEKSWSGEATANMSTVVCWLRRKLRHAEVPYVVRTVKGKGYLLQPAPSPDAQG